MSGTVKARLVKALVILALTFGILGLPSVQAQPTPPHCWYLIGCEFCVCGEDACVTGDPDCAGDRACCHAKFAFCWQWCVWP